MSSKSLKCYFFFLSQSRNRENCECSFSVSFAGSSFLTSESLRAQFSGLFAIHTIDAANLMAYKHNSYAVDPQIFKV